MQQCHIAADIAAYHPHPVQPTMLRDRVCWAVAVVLLIILSIALTTRPVHAGGIWYVAPGGSNGFTCQTPGAPCATLDGAIAKAAPGDTILIATGTYTDSGAAVVTLHISATLSGGWDVNFNHQTGLSTIDGQQVRRGIVIQDGVNAVIDRFIVQHGFDTNHSGGILNGSSVMTPTTLVLMNSRIIDNVGKLGGGIVNFGTLTISMTTISGNTAGGSCCIQNGGGGGLHNKGQLTIDTSIITANTVIDGYSGGGVYNSGIVTLTNSTISSNSAWYGGGIANFGAFRPANSTISNNSAYEGGGIYNQGMVSAGNTTMSNNTAEAYGGGLYNIQGVVLLHNTILARNAADQGPDCSGVIHDVRYSVIGASAGCNIMLGPEAHINIDAAFGDLQFNGAATPTHALLISSPAINAGTPTGCVTPWGTPLLTDQRGRERVGRCDIGAYEYQGERFQSFLALTRNDACLYLNDSFSTTGGGWSTDDDGAVRREYLANEYRILVRPMNWWIGVRPGIQCRDYVVSVDTRSVSPTHISSYGVIFGLTEDWSDFYTFELGPSNRWSLRRYDHGNWILLRTGFPSLFYSQPLANRIAVKHSGSQIVASVNNITVVAVDDPLPSGMRYMGLIVSSYEQPNIDIRFDNFIMTDAENLPDRFSGIAPYSASQSSIAVPSTLR